MKELLRSESMAKYKVQLGSLVTKLMERNFTVSANSEDEAIEKAKNRFIYECSRQKYTEVGGTINVDDIELVGD